MSRVPYGVVFVVRGVDFTGLGARAARRLARDRPTERWAWVTRSSHVGSASATSAAAASPAGLPQKLQLERGSVGQPRISWNKSGNRTSSPAARCSSSVSRARVMGAGTALIRAAFISWLLPVPLTLIAAAPRCEIAPY